MRTEIKKNLFIIGNGFDLAHNIPSKYSDFQKYIRSLYMTEELIDYSYSAFFPWKYTVPRTSNLLDHFDWEQPYTATNVLGFIDYCLARSQNSNQHYNFYINSDWKAIEELLGNLDLCEFLKMDQEDLFPQYDYDCEGLIYDIAECFKYLPKLASMWANQIDVSKAIPISDFDKLINKNRILPINNDVFLTFNYTPTLELLYGVNEVIHVHGIAGKRVMLGHDSSIDLDGFCKRNSIPLNCKHAAKVLLAETEKNTEKNISLLKPFISQKLTGITDIYSYGFSFSNVDLPYITLICKQLNTNDITWHLLDFDSQDFRDEYIKVIRKCGFLGHFTTYHIETNSKKTQECNQIKQFIKAKKAYEGKGHFYLEQLIIRYQTVNYTPSKLDMLLYIPRVIRCCFFLIIDKISRH